MNSERAQLSSPTGKRVQAVTSKSLVALGNYTISLERGRSVNPSSTDSGAWRKMA